MSPNDEYQGLNAAHSALLRAGIAPAAGQSLQPDAVATALAERVVQEVPAYTVSSNPDLIPGFADHLNATTADIAALLSGRRAFDFTYVANHAHWCADHKFPLEALLLAYRSTQQPILEWLRDAALATADESAQVRRVVGLVTEFVLRFTETLGTAATSEYVAHTRAIAEAEGNRRNQLMRVLLDGFDESDVRIANLLRRSGYLEQRQSYCVVIAQAVELPEMQNTARARRLRDAVRNAVDGVVARALVEVRDNEVIAIISKTRRMSGWTPQQASLAAEVREPLLMLGPSVLVGVSNDAPSTSMVPAAYREASVALTFAEVAKRVSFYQDIPLRDMMIREARTPLHASLPAWADTLAAADQQARGSLGATLRAYADASMNVQQAAKLIGVHPNTVYLRFEKLQELTGKDPLKYHDLTELLLAGEIMGA